MTTVELKDAKPAVDPIFTYVRDDTPLVIDNGSYQCRVGWATSHEPMMIFKNLIAKPRKERGKKDGDTQVGNDISNVEAVRFQLKTQFDRNVVTHFEAQEQILDHIFTHLGIDTVGCVDHPIVMTEAFLNPNYSRQLMSELLFECYGVPSVCYGVDALFALSRNGETAADATVLVVNCGHNTTHVLPVVNGTVDAGHARRLNLGGSQITSYLHRLLQLKYPGHLNAITPSRAEEIIHRFGSVASDYTEQLSLWADTDYYEENVIRIQLPYTAPPAPTGLTPEQQRERRKELARRLTEINARKREERLAEDEEQLNQLMAIQDLIEEGEEEEFKKALASYELENLNELLKMISQLQSRIEKTRQKIVAANTSEDPLEEPKAKFPKTTFQPKNEEEHVSWIESLRLKRKEMLEKRAARRQRRQDLARRRTAAAQERMRLISQLARKDKREDTFGMRDEDWDVYKAINKEGGDSDSDEEQKLMEVEELLRQHDPDFDGGTGSGGSDDAAETHQLHLGVELQRAPELLFQPSMLGSVEAGLAEMTEYALRTYSPEIRSSLIRNVLLVGGCAQLPGLAQRFHRELVEVSPFKSVVNVRVAVDPALDPWYGARDFAASELLKEALVSRQDYEERGGEFLREHAASNPFFPSPTAVSAGESSSVTAVDEVDGDSSQCRDV
ncbi:actin-related protein 5 isoform X1 [Schistocerca americana]|uniref:actin-related protein 5 isoform X1 n=1 Tax=Schistocerca americana TaxID=7009 RepID=UPI001F4F9641|nr:actin-related protein 5 isoform X1 [Schistocerca americana]